MNDLDDLFLKDLLNEAIENLTDNSTALDLIKESLKYTEIQDWRNLDIVETLIISARLFVKPNDSAFNILVELALELPEIILDLKHAKPQNVCDDDSEYDGWDDWEFIEKIEDLEMDLIKSKIEVRRLKELLTKAGLPHE